MGCGTGGVDKHFFVDAPAAAYRSTRSFTFTPCSHLALVARRAHNVQTRISSISPSWRSRPSSSRRCTLSTTTGSWSTTSWAVAWCPCSTCCSTPSCERWDCGLWPWSAFLLVQWRDVLHLGNSCSPYSLVRCRRGVRNLKPNRRRLRCATPDSCRENVARLFSGQLLYQPPGEPNPAAADTVVIGTKSLPHRPSGVLFSDLFLLVLFAPRSNFSETAGA